MTTETRTVAFDLLHVGLSVIPLIPKAKRPACKWAEFQTRQASEAECATWFARDRNIGIVTGQVSGLVVLDLDTPQSEAWADAHLPPTVTVQTGRGTHRYYRHPGGRVPNRAHAPVPTDPTVTVDVRGDGGYVVAPGSTHETGTVYTWRTDPLQDVASLPVFDQGWL